VMTTLAIFVGALGLGSLRLPRPSAPTKIASVVITAEGVRPKTQANVRIHREA